jgi:hypothetical protein
LLASRANITHESSRALWANVSTNTLITDQPYRATTALSSHFALWSLRADVTARTLITDQPYRTPISLDSLVTLHTLWSEETSSICIRIEAGREERLTIDPCSGSHACVWCTYDC